MRSPPITNFSVVFKVRRVQVRGEAEALPAAPQEDPPGGEPRPDRVAQVPAVPVPGQAEGRAQQPPIDPQGPQPGGDAPLPDMPVPDQAEAQPRHPPEEPLQGGRGEAEVQGGARELSGSPGRLRFSVNKFCNASVFDKILKEIKLIQIDTIFFMGKSLNAND